MLLYAVICHAVYVHELKHKHSCFFHYASIIIYRSYMFSDTANINFVMQWNVLALTWTFKNKPNSENNWNASIDNHNWIMAARWSASWHPQYKMHTTQGRNTQLIDRFRTLAIKLIGIEYYPLTKPCAILFSITMRWNSYCNLLLRLTHYMDLGN